MPKSNKPLSSRLLLKGCGCLASSGFVALVLALVLFGEYLHNQGIWGVWERCTNHAPPQVVSLARHDGDLFAGTADAGVFRSRDDGLNWEAFSRELASPEIRSLHAVAGSRWVLAITPKGLMRASLDRGLWTPVGKSRLTSSDSLTIVGGRGGDD